MIMFGGNKHHLSWVELNKNDDDDDDDAVVAAAAAADDDNDDIHTKYKHSDNHQRRNG